VFYILYTQAGVFSDCCCEGMYGQMTKYISRFNYTEHMKFGDDTVG